MIQRVLNILNIQSNEYNVSDLFHFPEEISKQDPNVYTANFDIDFLFTNIPPDETIDICLLTFSWMRALTFVY